MVERNTHLQNWKTKCRQGRRVRIRMPTLISCALRGPALHAEWDHAVAAGDKAISAAS